MEKELKTIQVIPILIITKAYHTVYTNTLNILANLPYVQLRIEKEVEVDNIMQQKKPFTWANEVYDTQGIRSVVDKWECHPAEKMSFPYKLHFDRMFRFIFLPMAHVIYIFQEQRL